MDLHGTIGRDITPLVKSQISHLFYQRQYTVCSSEGISQYLGISVQTVRHQLANKQHICARHPLGTKLPFNIVNHIDSLITTAGGEVSAAEIQAAVLTRFKVTLPLTTINRIRRSLGWIKSGVRYCQLIHHKNVQVRFTWALYSMLINDPFQYAIEIDEATIQLHQRTRSICYHRPNQRGILKPTPKHCFKLNLLGGISRLGRTPLIIFKGNLNASILIEIFSTTITPWIHEVHLSILYKFSLGYLNFSYRDNKINLKCRKDPSLFQLRVI